MKIVITKYLVLLAAMALSVYVLLIKNSFTWNMFYAVTGLSLLYILIAAIEYSLQVKQEQTDKKKYVYYTQGMITKKIIRIGGFMIASGILLFSGIKVLLFGILLFAMLVTEIISLFVKLRNKLFYVYFEEKSIVFFDDGVKRIYSSHIKEIEYRYNIFYLTLKNDQVRMIETERVEGEEAQKDFVKEFVFWAKTYDLPFTDEAKKKLGIEL